MTKVDAAAAIEVLDCSPAGWVSTAEVSAVVAGPALSAASLLEEIWSEVADWQCSRALAKPAPPLAPPPVPVPAPPASAFQPRALPDTPVFRALRDSAVLLLDGDAFVTALYHSLLGREPDPAGAAEVRADLARGRSKADILLAVRASPEATQWRARKRKDRLMWPFASLSRLSGKVLPGSKLHAALDQMVHAAGPPASAAGWRMQVEQRLTEQVVALQAVAADLGTLQAAQQELSKTTLAALLEQDRLVGDHAGRSTSLARQLTLREDELMAATGALSDEVDALGRRLAAATPDSLLVRDTAAKAVAPRRSKPARRP